VQFKNMNSVPTLFCSNLPKVVFPFSVDTPCTLLNCISYTVHILFLLTGVRALCDNLRREKDKAVGNLAQALRDLDDTRRELMRRSSEVKDLMVGAVNDALKLRINSHIIPFV
jgi:hypothetical protein